MVAVILVYSSDGVLVYFQVLAPGKISGNEYNREMLTVIPALVRRYSAHRCRQSLDQNTCSCCWLRSFHPQELLLSKSQVRECIKGGAKQVSEVLNIWNSHRNLFSELTQVIFFLLSGKPQWHRPSPADGKWQ